MSARTPPAPRPVAPGDLPIRNLDGNRDHDVDAPAAGTPSGRVRIGPILAVTDLSDHAAHAVERAALLAAEHGAKLQVLHVVAPAPFDAPPEWFAPPADPSTRIEQAEAALARAAASITSRFQVDIHTQVREGLLFEEIIRASEDADLLVLGARGSSRVTDIVLGSTASRLLTKCERPMLVVRLPGSAPYARVLVPVDLVDPADAALILTAALVPHAEVHVLHAYEVAYEGKLRLAGIDGTRIQGYRQAAKAKVRSELQMLVARHEPLDNPFHLAVQRGPALRLILERAARLAADLVVVTKRSRSVVEDVLLGSTTRRVVLDSGCDVLVMPAARQATDAD